MVTVVAEELVKSSANRVHDPEPGVQVLCSPALVLPASAYPCPRSFTAVSSAPVARIAHRANAAAAARDALSWAGAWVDLSDGDDGAGHGGRGGASGKPGQGTRRRYRPRYGSVVPGSSYSARRPHIP